MPRFASFFRALTLEHVARSKYGDFDEVVSRQDQIPVIAINIMYEMENGPEVAYYLGKHSEVRERLLDWNRLGTKGGYRHIVVELDRISRALSSSRSSGSYRTISRTATPDPGLD